MMTFGCSVEYDSAGIDIFNPDLPGERFYLWLFEGLGDRRHIYNFGLRQDDWRLESPSKIKSSGLCFNNAEIVTESYGYVKGSESETRPSDSDDPIKVDAGISGSDSGVDFEVKIENLGNSPLYCAYGDVCFQLRFSKSFAGEEEEGLERTYVLINNRWTALKDTRRKVDSNAWSPMVQAYSIAGTDLPYPKGIPPRLHRWSVSPDKLSDGIIVVMSRDRKWSTGFTWQQSIAVARNWGKSHDCMHCDVGFGDIMPGTAVERSGRIYFVKGTPDDLLKVYARDRKSWL